jgi:glycosyltransferase involved in cell wall biosynthesis
MKILLLNRDDAEGGAAKGATRLLEGIRSPGVDARLFVQRKMCNSPCVIGSPATLGKAVGFARRTLESLLYKLASGKVQGLFSPAFLPDRISSRVSRFAPDIIHLHWVARMMRIETLSRFKVPIVWTLHDSWPFTGGCFLPLDCTRYRESCGACPVLGSSREEDLSRRVWRRKKEAWRGLNLTLVAPSRWMAARAQTSSLFRETRIEVIPNGIDVQLYQPSEQSSARERLSLPQKKRLILFGAKDATQDRNKGFHLLVQSLRALTGGRWRDDIELLVFGSKEPDKPQDHGFKAHYLGWQDDKGLALLYAAADVFVLPSIQENLPYTVMEAMACGTPCVAFNIGGVSDLIDHRQNGYLAQPFDPEDLARGITYVLEDAGHGNKLAVRARQKVVLEFALEKIADRHMALYREILMPDCSQNF